MKILIQRSFPLVLLFTIILGSFSGKAQKWDTLAQVPTAMTFPVVTVLDGKIHIMGGGASGGATKLHYAYDPATNSWDPKAMVPYFAQQPAGGANNGKIHYFGGGYPNSGTPLKDHYIYDPTADAWTKAADLTQARAIHSSVALDGTIYTLGGQGVANLFQAYDATSDSWVNKANLPDNSFWYGAHVAAEGRIYRFCGGGYTAPSNKANVYDPVTNSWTSLPNFPNANHSIKGAAIGDKIYLAGGYYDFLDRDEVWVYDTKAETYTASTKLPIGRSYLNVVSVDSCIYAVGGNNAIDPTVSTQLLRFCPYKFPTSVKDVFHEKLVSANYSNGMIHIWLPEENISELKLDLFDQLGKSILTKQVVDVYNEKLDVQVNNLSAGIYFARLEMHRNVYIAKVFVF